jgi:tRNA-splicing endonuclease subunit Sen2
MEHQTTTTTESNDNMNENATTIPEGAPSRTPRPKRPNYHALHARPLPLSVYPIPNFIPHNPLSLLRVAYLVLRDWVAPPSSHATTYSGYFSEATQSVHVTDPATVRALWEMGFFGTGTLSRSEPNWLSMERRRLGMVAFMTAEEVTSARRKVRMEFKRERARLEREVLEEQKRKENAAALGLPSPPESETEDIVPKVSANLDLVSKAEDSAPNGDQPMVSVEIAQPQLVKVEEKHDSVHEPEQDEVLDEAPGPEEPVNQEHLQLSLSEAFYLSYSLGALKVVDPTFQTPIDDSQALLQLFRQKSYFPPVLTSQLKSDDPFLLSYVVYHHFRSLGWVVREGIKFAVDYLLYERGPVFMHATFAIMIVPSYTDPYWYATPARTKEVERKMARKSWHWLHCANRIQGNVVKTLILAYVDVPAPVEGQTEDKDIGKLLQRYKVREFALRRWSANRNRD